MLSKIIANVLLIYLLFIFKEPCIKILKYPEQLRVVPHPLVMIITIFLKIMMEGDIFQKIRRGGHHSIFKRIRKRRKRRRMNRGCRSHWLVWVCKMSTRHHYSDLRWCCSRMRYMGRRFPKNTRASYFCARSPSMIVILKNF